MRDEPYDLIPWETARKQEVFSVKRMLGVAFAPGYLIYDLAKFPPDLRRKGDTPWLKRMRDQAYASVIGGLEITKLSACLELVHRIPHLYT